MAASDALLLGRVTYEHLAAYWPNQLGGEPMVDYINSVPKYVVSGTLEEPLRWNNSAIIRGNMAEEISRLKRQPGKDITILGSGILVRSLLRDGLLDELTLMVHPEMLGSGKRLFKDRSDPRALKLEGSRTFGTGVVSLWPTGSRKRGKSTLATPGPRSARDRPEPEEAVRLTGRTRRATHSATPQPGRPSRPGGRAGRW
jgi:dihydrofolate reductase